MACADLMERLEEVMVSLHLCYDGYGCSERLDFRSVRRKPVSVFVSQESGWLVSGTRAVSSRPGAAMND